VYCKLRAECDGDETADKGAYRTADGSLLHMERCMCPEIAVLVGVLAACYPAPTAVHFSAMLDVVRYVGSTASHSITFRHAEVLRLGVMLLCSEQGHAS
jgi:hypothetical protein